MTDPRTALEALVDATSLLPEDAPEPGPGPDMAAVWYERGWDDRGDAIRAALATPPATGTVERCGYQMFVGRLCGGTPDAPLHDAHHVDYHPYHHAPPATEERCEDCAGNFVDGHCARHAPAPEPSAARKLREAVGRRDASAAIAALDALHAPEPRAALEALVRLVEPRWSTFPGDWACVECVPTSDMLVAGFLCGYHRARAALAHPTLARVIAIGQAWVAAEEAVLGRGAGIEMTVRTLPGAGAVASWYDRVDGEGDRLPSEPTPEAALLALAAALTDQERGS